MSRHLCRVTEQEALPSWCEEAPLPLCLPVFPGCSSKTCRCPDHTLLGSVVTQSGHLLPGARISLRDSPGTVAISDEHGTFRMPGVCASSRANVSAQMDGFLAGVGQAQANGSISALVTVVLTKLGECLVARMRGLRSWGGNTG